MTPTYRRLSAHKSNGRSGMSEIDNGPSLELVPLQEILNRLDEAGMRDAIHVIQDVICVK